MRIGEVIEGLTNGTLGIQQAEQEVRKIRWPKPEEKTVRQTIVDEAQDNYRMFPPTDGFFLVEAAYTRGEITEAQYRRLHRAATSGTG